MKKVLVFGATGMAGHMVALYLKQKKYEVNTVCYRNKFDEESLICDINNYKDVEEIVKVKKPEVIINCIGVLNKTAEENIRNTVYVNTFFPRFLDNLSKKNNFKLIHISTDCVFDGKDGMYNETTFKSETGIYGLSKNLGEIINEDNLTFRTSIIGPELKNGSGLFHWFMNQKDKVNGYKKVIWTGVTTLELAKAIDEAIKNDLKGLYHLVNNEQINKFELVKLFNKYFKNSELNIVEFNDYISDKSLINTRTDFDYSVISYKDMIKEMRQWMDEKKEIYSLYEW